MARSNKSATPGFQKPGFFKKPGFSSTLQFFWDDPYYRFWQAGSGYDVNVSEPMELHEIILYIHENPVRRGLVARAEDWIWSSARDWAGLPTEDVPCRIDRTLPATLEIP